MNNSFCKRSLQLKHSSIQGGILVHEGVTGMHWGYRYHQPYSSGYQAQEKGIFLGQLASKLRRSDSGSSAKIHKIGRDGSTYTTKKSLKETLRDIYGTAKNKFDAWNKIDTSKTMAEAMRLQKRAQSELEKSHIYGKKQDIESVRLRYNIGDNNVTSNIVSALSEMRETHKARANKLSVKSNELYNQAQINTKMKKLASKLGISEAKVRYGKILSDMCSLGQTNVSDIPSALTTLMRSNKLSKVRLKNQLNEMNKTAERNTGEILSRLAGLRKEQGLMPVGQIASLMQHNLGKNRDLSDEWKLIRQELSKRQAAGYRDTESGIEKLMHNIWFVTGNEPGRRIWSDYDELEAARQRTFDY